MAAMPWAELEAESSPGGSWLRWFTTSDMKVEVETLRPSKALSTAMAVPNFGKKVLNYNMILSNGNAQ